MEFREMLSMLIVILMYTVFAVGEQRSRNANSHKNDNNRRSNIRRQLPQLQQVHLREEGFDVNLTGPRERVEQRLDEAWNAFKITFNKVYATPEEEKYRREIFIENAAKIFHMNDDYAKGYTSHAQKINSYADMLHHEFEAALNGFNRSSSEPSAAHTTPASPTERATSFIPSANVPIPDSVDWRKLGAVTPVRSQSLCAACYAFSAVGALEGQYFRKTGILNDLSAQNLIDCTNDYGNFGCKGGLMNPAFQYVKDNNGIDIEGYYPYEAADNQCRFKPEGFGADSSGYVMIPEGDEEALKVAVSTIGPVAAAMDASRNTLQFYSDGVYFDGECKNATSDMNHAVLVVGYDTDPSGKQFWWIKNSYGTDWGIGGYMKLARHAGNHCGIATLASYPLV